jgi:sensor histidine kinase YesM
MKSILKFLVLLVIPLVIITFFSILLSGNLDDLKDAKVVFYSIFFFATISFSYVSIFENRNIIKKNIFYRLFVSGTAVFIIIFVFGIFFPAFTFESRNLLISLFQSTLAVCLFVLEYLVVHFYSNFNTNKRLVFTDHLFFYLRLVFFISIIESILIGIMTIDIFLELISFHHFFNFIKPIILIPLLINFASFLSLKFLNKVDCLNSKSLFVIVLSTFISFLGVTIFSFLQNNYVYRANFLFLILCVFSTLLFFTIIENRDQLNISKKKISFLSNNALKLNSEYLQLKQQVNPHFLFNNLNTLISFIEVNPKKAIEFGHHLSNTYRYYLKNEKDDFVLVTDELMFIQEYLEIFKAKFENGFEYLIEAKPNENDYMLSLSLQELIDNIFKHNILDTLNPLRISISINNDFLQITNTIQLKMNVNANNSGLSNIKKRYDFLTNKSIEISNDGKNFIVKLPILKVELT